MVQSQGERRRYVAPLPSATCTPRAHCHYFSEKSLTALKLARRNKVEDFKKKTNYYETRELLERYEDGPSNGPPSARPIDDTSSRRQSQLLVTPQRAVPAVPPNTPPNLRIPSISPGLQSQLSRKYQNGVLFVVTHILHSRAETPQQPLSPPRKLWYDKLADALLGDDESPVNVAASRYALICQKCFAHNGLVKEDVWEITRTHDPLLLVSRVDDDGCHFLLDRICLSQVRVLQPLCPLPAQRFTDTATNPDDADSVTASTARCIAAECTTAPEED